MGDPVDFYGVLNIPKDSSPEDIRKAYKALVRRWHPDKNPPSSKKEAEAKFKAITQAYEALSDKEYRSMFGVYHNVDGEGSAGHREVCASPKPSPSPSLRVPDQRQHRTDGQMPRRANSDGYHQYFAMPGSRMPGAARRKPPPVERKLECTLEELCRGCKKEIRFTREVLDRNTGMITRKEEVQTVRVKPGCKNFRKNTCGLLTKILYIIVCGNRLVNRGSVPCWKGQDRMPKRKANTTNLEQTKGCGPDWMGNEIWNALIDNHWSSENWKKKSKAGHDNRLTKKEGGVSKHSCGSISFATHKKRMSERLGRPVNHLELFDATHKCGTSSDFIDMKSKSVSEKYKVALESKYGQDSSSYPPFDLHSWLEVTGAPSKGRIYGFGQLHTYNIQVRTDSSSYSCTSSFSTIFSQQAIDEQLQDHIKQKVEEARTLMREELKAEVREELRKEIAKQVWQTIAELNLKSQICDLTPSMNDFCNGEGK